MRHENNLRGNDGKGSGLYACRSDGMVTIKLKCHLALVEVGVQIQVMEKNGSERQDIEGDGWELRGRKRDTKKGKV